MTTYYRVPPRDVAPSEDMIDWLAQCTQDWEGDEEGIVVHPPAPSTAEPAVGLPGDWVVEHAGEYRVYSHEIPEKVLRAARLADKWPDRVTADDLRAARRI